MRVFVGMFMTVCMRVALVSMGVFVFMFMGMDMRMHMFVVMFALHVVLLSDDRFDVFKLNLIVCFIRSYKEARSRPV
jgi:hypothetical protein